MRQAPLLIVSCLLLGLFGDSISSPLWAGARPMAVRLLLGPSGSVPPNAAIVLTGYTSGLRPKVSAQGKPIDVQQEVWPDLGFDTVWLVRPTKGEWPAGATLELREEGSGFQAAVRIGTRRDVTAPALPGKLGPSQRARYQRAIPGISPDRFPWVEATRLTHPALSDDESPVVKIDVRWSNGGGADGSASATVLRGSSGQLESASAAPCDGKSKLTGQIVDTAGNARTLPANGCL